MVRTSWGPTGNVTHVTPLPLLTYHPHGLFSSCPASNVKNTNSSLLIKTIYTTTPLASRWDYEPKQEVRGSDSSLTRPGENLTYSQLRAKLPTRAVAPLVLEYDPANTEYTLVHQLEIAAR